MLFIITGARGLCWVQKVVDSYRTNGRWAGESNFRQTCSQSHVLTHTKETLLYTGNTVVCRHTCSGDQLPCPLHFLSYSPTILGNTSCIFYQSWWLCTVNVLCGKALLCHSRWKNRKVLSRAAMLGSLGESRPVTYRLGAVPEILCPF